MSYIAEQAGGFACIGRDNKLYIKTISSTVAEVVPFRLFQKYMWGEEFKVSRVAYEDGTQDFKFGNTTNNTIWINQDNMYIVDEEQVQNIYNLYKDFICYSFEGTTIINPALDLGDMIEVDGKKVIYQGKIEYKRKFKADISSEIQVKSKEDSMVTRTSTANKIRRIQSTIDQVEGILDILATEVDEHTTKMADFQITVDGITQEVSQNTTDILNVKSDAVKEAIKATEKELGIKLKDYPTTAQVSTIIETKAGEIETRLNGTITTQMSNYVTKTVMDTTIQTSINGFSSTVSETYLTKTNASNDFVEKKKVISSINQTSESVSINANKINLNGAVTANNYFKINTDGSMEAKAGTIANISISENGLFYSEAITNTIGNGFGLWKGKHHLWNNKYIIFHAGSDANHIGSAPCKIYHDGSMDIAGFTITGDSIDSSTTGMSNGHQYAFYVKSGSTTPYFVTLSGDVSCKSIIVNGYPLVRTVATSGQCVNTFYKDGGQLVATVDGSICVVIPDSITSDEKYKRNIEDTKVNALEFYKKLHFRQFNMKESGEFQDLGLIAQELEEIDDSLVSEITLENGETTKLIQQSKFIMRNAKAIQELYAEVEKLKVKEV